ncbi:MAG: Tn3 family transposase [Blastocatellia bacterium]
MASIERTAYPRFKRVLTPQILHTLCTPTEDEIRFVRRIPRPEGHQLSMILLLKCFQWLGWFPKFGEMPTLITNHIRSCLGLGPEVEIGYDHSRTLYRHHQLIRDYLRVTGWGKDARKQAMKAVIEAAGTMDNPADLINVALESLIKERYELPAFSTLDRIVRRLRNLVNQRYFNEILGRLTWHEENMLGEILESDSPAAKSSYQRLKQLPKSPTLKHLKEWLAQLEWLVSLGNIDHLLANLPPLKVKHFAAEAKALDVAELRDFKPPKRYTLILCLIHRARVQCRDQLVLMLIKRMNKIHQHGKEQLEELRLKYREKTASLVSLLANVVTASAGSSSDEQLGHSVRQLIEDQGPPETLLEECERVVAYSGENYQALLWRYYRTYRSALFRLIKSLTLSSTSQDQSLMNAVTYMLKHEDTRGEWLPDEVDLFFTSERWLRAICATRNGEPMLNRRHFEVCVFTHLAAELKSGDISVAGSDEYADHREQLVPWEECEPLVANYCRELDMPMSPVGFTSGLRRWLTETARRVDDAYPDNEELVIDEDGQPRLKKLPSPEQSASIKELESVLYNRLPERNVIDILSNVAHYTSFTRHFGPLSGSDPKIERALERYLLTTFTYGCNLGPAQAARHLRGLVTPHELSFVNRRHFNSHKLNSAIVDIINDYSAFALPKFWGMGKSAAADGTKYDLYDQNLLAEYHIRYGGWGGIAYHHVSDNYVALFSHFIPCGTWEAIYIIEGLLKNASELQPDTVHADTQGQSAPVFALAHLLGIKLMPRIRNWKDLIFYRADKKTRYKHIDRLFTDNVDWRLIETHWQDMMQVVLSIKAGKISSVTLLRKLGHESRKNRLYQAFRELGRVVRTVFLLQYLSDPSLRKQITAMTNKVESYNGFAGWLFFGGEGIIAENDPDEQEKIIKYNDLVANAVVFQNVIDISRILCDLIGEGYPLKRVDVEALSPYLTRHVKRFGDYYIDVNSTPPPLSQMDLSLTL